MIDLEKSNYVLVWFNYNQLYAHILTIAALLSQSGITTDGHMEDMEMCSEVLVIGSFAMEIVELSSLWAIPKKVLSHNKLSESTRSIQISNKGGEVQLRFWQRG